MSHGRFSGDPVAVWQTEDGVEDRNMKLLHDFFFVDPSSKKWLAPAGSVVDGASIPRSLWTVVGSPYTGDYRRASVVHDVACVEAGGDTRKRRAADRMFFHACRAGGCTIWQSTILYLGVRVGATVPDVPSWHAAIVAESAGPRLARSQAERRLEQDFRAVADRVLAPGETDDPQELERRTDAALPSVTGLRKASARRRRRPRRAVMRRRN